MSTKLSALAIFFLTFSLQANAKTLVVVGFEYEPFYFSDGSKGVQGACFDIMTKLCQMESLACKFKMMPFRKALESLKIGKSDAICPLVESTPRGSAYNFSTDVFNTSYAFYGLPKTTQGIKKYEDLAGKTVVVFGPSNTELSLQKINEFLDHKIKIVLEGAPPKSLKKTDANQYPLVYVNTDVGDTWIRRNRSKLQEVPNLREYTGYRIAYSKKSVSKEMYDKLEGHLQSIKKSKELSAICEKYKLNPAEGP